MFNHTTRKKILMTTVALSIFTSPMLSVHAQEISLNKVPNLSKGLPASITAQQEDVVMPANYPSDLDGIDANIRSMVVVDEETNKIIASKDANTPYPIASLSKVISTYLVYKTIEEGKLKLTDQIVPSAEIVQYFSANLDLTAVGLVEGATYTVEDMLYAMMMVSGNDATTALLSHIYGSEQEAVKAIKQQLNEWGMTNFEFYTTSGVPVSYLPESMRVEGATDLSENTMSAADVAKMTKRVIEEYPQILDLTKAESYIFAKGTPNEKTLVAFNPLLPGGELGRKGVTGLKSGYTDAAGKSLITTSTENNRKIISVVMGVMGESSSYQETHNVLTALATHQNLYQLEGLTVNDVEKTSEATVDAIGDATGKPVTNANQPKESKRNSWFANLMKSIFGFLN